MPDTSSQQSIGMPFIELQTVDSTNNYAFSQIHAGLAQHGMAVFSHEQTAAKGQRGKKWVSLKGSAIALSIIIKPVLKVAQQFQLSACTALSVHTLLKSYLGNELKIKWPNDLYWKDRKAGGILIESVVRSPEPGGRGHQSETNSWLWAVMGIGINVNQTLFPPELPNPVSLKQVTGKNFEPIELAKELCGIFNNQLDRMINGGFEGIYKEYLSHLYKINEKVKFKKDNRVFEAIIKGVTTSGKLIVQHSMEEELDFGTVEWVI